MHHYACNFDYIFFNDKQLAQRYAWSIVVYWRCEWGNMNWNSIPWCFGLETRSEELNENNEINMHTQIKRHEMPQLHLFFVLFFCCVVSSLCLFDSLFLLCLLLTAGVLDIICKLMKRLKSGFSRIMFPIYRKRFKT